MRILVLDVGGTNIKSAVVDETNTLSDERTTPSYQSQNPGQASLMPSVLDVVRTYSDYDVLSVSMTGQMEEKTQRLLIDHGRHDKATNLPIGARAVPCISSTMQTRQRSARLILVPDEITAIFCV